MKTNYGFIHLKNQLGTIIDEEGYSLLKLLLVNKGIIAIYHIEDNMKLIENFTNEEFIIQFQFIYHYLVDSVNWLYNNENNNPEVNLLIEHNNNPIGIIKGHLGGISVLFLKKENVRKLTL